jgi:glutaconate CoA-transferase subunit A
MMTLGSDGPPAAARPSGPGRASKLVTLEDAAALVPSGGLVAIGGLWFQNNPSALARQLIRAGARDLRIVAAPPSSYAVDLLIGARAVARAYVAHVSFDHLGLAPNFRRAAETGAVEIVDCDEATVLGGLMATVEALPYHPVTSINGTDLVRTSPLAAPQPVAGRGPVAAPSAMAPDVALLHAQEADVYGNVRYFGTPFCDPLFAKTARTVIVSVDRIIDNSAVRAEPHRTVIPGYLVDAVVEAPYGAHPAASQGRYPHDEEHLAAYIKAGRSEQEWRARYLQPWVLDTTDGPAYLGKVAYLEKAGGPARLESLDEVVP